MSIRNDLLLQGYSIQPLADFDKIINYQKAWQDFVELPLPVKKKFIYQNGCGYEFKGKKKSFDEKDNFHLSMIDVPRLKHISKSLGKKSERTIGNFINAGTDSFEVIRKFILDLVVPEIKPLVIEKSNLEKELLDSCNGWFQRSLFYHPRQDSNVSIADAHPDKGFITLAYFASETGLEILDLETMKWKAIIIPAGSVLIMLGMQGQYLTGGKIKALYHRVMNSIGTIARGRFAQVGFCDNKFHPFYNKKKHGSTQLKPIGFNYKCPHKEFLENYI